MAKKRTKDIELPDDSNYPGSENQLMALHKKWGKQAGLDHKSHKDLDDAERNKIYEYDQRGGSFFSEPKPIKKKKRNVGLF